MHDGWDSGLRVGEYRRALGDGVERLAGAWYVNKLRDIGSLKCR